MQLQPNTEHRTSLPLTALRMGAVVGAIGVTLALCLSLALPPAHAANWHPEHWQSSVADTVFIADHDFEVSRGKNVVRLRIRDAQAKFLMIDNYHS